MVDTRLPRSRTARDERKLATLRGVPVSVADIGDQVHLCHPLLSFDDDPSLYMAHLLDWANDDGALEVADSDEASTLGTLLPPTCRWRIASGQGVVVVGKGFAQAANTAGIDLLALSTHFSQVDSPECWIGVATPDDYAALRTGLDNQARSAFDKELGYAASRRSHLSERGDAALLIIRRCGSGHCDDLAIRQLAGAHQNEQFDLYQRLLIGFAFELNTQKQNLDERVQLHLAGLAPPASGQRLRPHSQKQIALHAPTGRQGKRAPQ